MSDSLKRQTAKTIYALLISAHYPAENAEGAHRNDQVWIDRLAKKTFKVDLGASEGYVREWYKGRGFDVQESTLHLTKDNYNRLCG